MIHTTASIYGLAGPDGKIRYVGSTVHSINTRLQSHINGAKRGETFMRVFTWIRDVGPDNVHVELLETCSIADRFIREAEWTVKLQTSGDSGLNDYIGSRPSTSAIEKMAAPHRGAKRSDETRARISDSLTGKPLSDEHKQKLSELHRGRIWSDERNTKISKSLTGRNFADEHRLNLSRSNHMYWHVGRGKSSQKCQFCVEE